MENLLGHEFYGKWRFSDSDFSSYGNVRINENGNASLVIIENIPEDWYKKLKFPNSFIIGDFLDKETKKGYCIILAIFLNGEVRHDFLSNYYLFFKHTLISYPIDNHIDGKWTNEITSLEFNTFLLSGKILRENYPFEGLEVNSSEKNKTKIDFSTKYANPKILYSDHKHTISLGWKIENNTNQLNNVKLSANPWVCIEEEKSHYNFIEIFEKKTNIEQLYFMFFKKSYHFGEFELVHKNGYTFRVLGMQENSQYDFFNGFERFLKESFSTVYPSWLEIIKAIGFGISNFYKAHTDKLMLPSQKFVLYCFSLELLHKAYFNNNENLLKKHSNIITKISEELKGKGELETWFQKHVNKNREISFQNRLEELIEHSELIIETPEFSKRVKDTRNKYAHLDDNNGNPFNDSEILYNLQLLSRVFIEIVHKKLVTKY